jgi:glutathione peroxidase
MSSLYDFSAKTIDGETVSLGQWRGQVMLIVNTASKCGFTPQYEGLEALHEAYGPRGLAVLGFPCNQFGGQEPGDEAEIARFCSSAYAVGFPMFAKIAVNGEDADPLFVYLKKAARGVLGTEAIKWNFTKFLVARDGTVIDRFAPAEKPEALRPRIESLL